MTGQTDALMAAVTEARREDRPHTVYYRRTRRHAWRIAGYTQSRTAAIEWAHGLRAESAERPDFRHTLALPSDVPPTGRVLR